MWGRVLFALVVGACATEAPQDETWQLPVCPKGEGELSAFYEPRQPGPLPDGLVVLTCTTVGEERALACSVAEESPEAYGFAAVALQFSEGLRLCDETPDQASPFALRFPFKNMPGAALAAYSDEMLLALEPGGITARPAPSP